MKQTAVEWLAGQLPLGVKGSILDKIEQAKEMEKQQIIDAYIECKKEYIVKMDCYPPQFVVDEAKQYYNQRFKNE
jgi:hypothetical protein